MNPPLGLRGIPQTIAEMERAGLMRFEEGVALLSRGHGGAGVYLLGLSAEMLLKTSYFLVESFRTSELVPPLLVERQPQSWRTESPHPHPFSRREKGASFPLPSGEG